MTSPARPPDGVVVHRPASREDWLALRAANVGASVAGCLLGVHEYQSAFGLWAQHRGLVAEDPEETPPMRRGRLLEDDAIQLVQEERPHWTVTPNPIPGGFYFVDPALRLAATPDAFVDCPERGRGVLQVKTVTPSQFRRKWLDDETGEVVPPLWIGVQAIVEAHLTGAAWAAVAAMRVGFGLDLDIVPVPVHAGVVARVRAAVAEFWDLVESGRQPDFDYGRDADLIAEIYSEDDGTEVDLSDDNRLPALAAEQRRLAAVKRDAERGLLAVNAEILTKIGPATVAHIRGGRITARTVRRKAFTLSVPASSYRTPRVTLDKETAS